MTCYDFCMPRLVDHDQRRREFATSVWGIVATKGIEGVTLRAVAKEAGVSVGRLQHYYASREELVQDSCRVMIAVAAQSVDVTEDQPPLPPDPAAQLRAVLLSGIPTSDISRRGVAIWTAYVAKSVDDPVIADLIADAQRGTVDYVATLIAATIPDAAQTEPQALALELLACADGLGTRVLTGSLSGSDAVATLEQRLAQLLD